MHRDDSGSATMLAGVHRERKACKGKWEPNNEGP